MESALAIEDVDHELIEAATDHVEDGNTEIVLSNSVELV